MGLEAGDVWGRVKHASSVEVCGVESLVGGCSLLLDIIIPVDFCLDTGHSSLWVDRRLRCVSGHLEGTRCCSGVGSMDSSVGIIMLMSLLVLSLDQGA